MSSANTVLPNLLGGQSVMLQVELTGYAAEAAKHESARCGCRATLKISAVPSLAVDCFYLLSEHHSLQYVDHTDQLGKLRLQSRIMTTIEYDYERLTPDWVHILRLHLGASDDGLRGELQTVSLVESGVYDPPAFEALSYVQGSSTACDTLCVSGMLCCHNCFPVQYSSPNLLSG